MKTKPTYFWYRIVRLEKGEKIPHVQNVFSISGYNNINMKNIGAKNICFAVFRRLSKSSMWKFSCNKKK